MAVRFLILTGAAAAALTFGGIAEPALAQQTPGTAGQATPDQAVPTANSTNTASALKHHHHSVRRHRAHHRQMRSVSTAPENAKEDAETQKLNAQQLAQARQAAQAPGETATPDATQKSGSEPGTMNNMNGRATPDNSGTSNEARPNANNNGAQNTSSMHPPPQ